MGACFGGVHVYHSLAFGFYNIDTGKKIPVAFTLVHYLYKHAYFCNTLETKL